jgi:hypothetical protein
MPRIVPMYRARLMYELFRQIRKSKAIGPNYIRAVDRLAKLDRLYDVELTKPYEQPHKEAEVVQDDINADALEDKALLDAFNKKHYCVPKSGGKNVGTTAETGNSAAAVRGADTPNTVE